MTVQQQEQQANSLHKRRNLWPRLLITGLILLLIGVGTVLWILTSHGAFTSVLPLVIFTVLGVLIALFQWLFPVSSSPLEHPSVHASPPQAQQNTPIVTQMQPIIVHVPATQPLVPLEKAAYRGIVGLPPSTDARTIQQREQVVREVYGRLLQPNITAITLTGIGGVGKSTLAALIYRYTEEQRQTASSPFLAE